MKDERYLVILLFSTLFIRELWTLLPYNPAVRNYFLLYDMKMTFQTYIYFPCHFLANAIVIYILGLFFVSLTSVFKIWFYIQIFEVIDYFVMYNTPWVSFNVFGLDVDFGITLFKMIILFVFIYYKLSTWKT